MTCHGSKLLGAALVLFFSFPAHAQIVNVLPRTETTTEGWNVDVSSPLEWRRGPTDRLRIGGNLQVRWASAPHTLLFVAQGEHERTNGDLTIGRHFQHLRYQHTLSPLLTLEAFVQHAADEKARLNLRALAGAGPRFTLLQGTRGHLWLGIAYLYEIERYQEAAGVEERRNHRASSYLRGVLRIDDTLSLSHVTFFQPALNDPANARMSSESSVILSWRALSLRPTFQLIYDPYRPAGVDKLETILLSTAGISF